MHIIICGFLIFLGAEMVSGQGVKSETPSSDGKAEAPATPVSADPGRFHEYLIGRDDLLDIAVFEAPELAAIVRVSGSGVISLPLIGTIAVADKSTQEIERLIEHELKKNSLNDPQVRVFVREYASQPVSVVGAVKNAGIYQIKGQKSLLEVLAMAQGLDPNAGKTIQVIRKSAPRAGRAVTTTSIEVDVKELFQDGKTELDIPIHPNDVVNVSRAESIFIVGEFTKPGEYVLRNGEAVTFAEAVAIGGGFLKDAKRKDSVIIRVHKDGRREEIRVDGQKLIEKQTGDVLVMPNDILYVPPNKVKNAINRVLESTVSIVTGRLIIH